MKTTISAAMTASLVFTAAMQADTLELKNGQVVEGNYEGGTAQTLRFQTGNETKVFQRNETVALTFAGTKSAKNTSNVVITGAASAAGATLQATTITVPAGTPLQVRMVDGVDSSRDAAGKRFTGTLDSNLSVNGVTLAPMGTTVHGQLAQVQEAGRLAGQSALSMVLTDVVINGEAKPLSTTPLTMSGQAEGRDTARRAGRGAIVGGIVNGGEGAGKGAAIGAGASGLRKGEAVNVPPGSLLQFNLNQPLTLQSH